MKNKNHIKNTFKHAIIYGGSGLIAKAVGFIMLPIYANQLHAVGYGILGMIDTVLSVMTLLIGYGISGAMTRFYYETEDAQYRNTIVSTTIILMLFLVSSVASLPLFFAKQIAWLAFGHQEWAVYIQLAILSFIGSMTAKNAEKFILIQQKSIFYSVISLGRLVLGLSLNIYFIVILEMGVLGFLYSSLIDAFSYTVLMHCIALSKVGIKFEKKIAKEVLAFSLPLLPGYVAMFIRNNANRIILRTSLGLATVGVFEMLFKFVSMIGFLVFEPFFKIWDVKRFEICELDDGPQIIARVFTYHMAVMLFLALLFSLEIPVVLRLLTPPEFWLSGFIVFFAVMSIVLNGAYYHLFFGLHYAKKTSKVSIIQSIVTICNLSLAFPLVLNFDLFGAVLTSLLSVLIQCIITFFIARPYYRIPFEWQKVFAMVGVVTALFCISKDFSVSNTATAVWLNSHIAPEIKNILILLSLDGIKDGKLLLLAVNSLPILADGIILACFSCSFLLALIVLKIIPIDMVIKFKSFIPIRKPINNPI